MSTIRSAGGLAALALFAAGGPAAQAQERFYYNYGRVQVEKTFDPNGNQNFDEYFGDSEDPDNPAVPVDLGINITSVGTARARAAVGPGVNRAAVQVVGLDPAAPALLLAASAESSWLDLVTISDPALDGTPGTFTTTLRVTGSGAFAASQAWHDDARVDAGWEAGAFVSDSLEGEQYQSWSGRWESDGAAFVYAGDPLGAYQAEVTFRFTYGREFSLGGSLFTDLYVDNSFGVPGTIDASIDLSHTVTWGGMRGLSANATLSSTTGTDWRLPQGPAVATPEPASLGLVLAGGLGLLGYARRRRAAA